MENNIDIAIIRNSKQYFSKIESELFNRRITKTVKVAKDPNLRLLWEKMRVANYLSNEPNNLYSSYAKQLNHITIRRDQSKRQREKANRESVNQYSSSQFQNTTLSNDTTLLNILESHLADNTEAKHPIDLEARQSIGESPNNNFPENNADTPNSKRIERMFISQNVFNLSDRVLTENEIKVLDKGLNFVPTPEKLDRLQIKNDLEKLGRDIKLRIFYQNDLSQLFSENTAFKIPSSWTPPSRDIQLELYLNEIEDKLISINENRKSYPNLSKDEREALKSLMNDNEIIIKPADKCCCYME